MSKKRWYNAKLTLKIIQLIIRIIAIFWILLYLNFKDSVESIWEIALEDDVTIEIEPWDTIKWVLVWQLWYDKTMLDFYMQSHPELKIWVKIWNFDLKKWSNIYDIVDILETSSWAQKESEVITLLEWWNIYDIDEKLTNKWYIQSSEFIAKVKDIEKYKDKYEFLLDALSLEWFIYPDTYSIDRDKFDLDNFIDITLDNFKSKVYDKISSEISLDELYDTLKMASIVEREERDPEWRPTVAGILLKRLNNNWMIWADITACYAHALTSEECRLSLSSYIYDVNDYNTRTMTWLPKTPINNPSYSAIDATINYKDSEYWYYLHDTSTWEIYFGRNESEHNANKAKYIR